MISELFTSCGSMVANKLAGSDTFQDVESQKKYTFLQVLVMVTVYVLLLLVILLVGKLLWNDYACKYITILKPVPSVVELLAIILLLSLVLPKQCVC